MKKREYTLTKEGYEQLKKEYEQLSEIDYPRVLDQMHRARELGDLRENEAYHSARNKLAMIKGRIEELELILENAKIVDKPMNNGVVGLGSSIDVSINGKRYKYVLVSEQEADLANGKISAESPIGKALMGAKVGEDVKFEAPSGTIVYKVEAVA